MVASTLKAQFEDARSPHEEASADLDRLPVRMAIDTVVDVLPGAATLVAFGDVDESLIPRLRTQRVLATDGSVPFDVDAGHADRSVEDALGHIDVDLLDVLIRLRPDVYSGHVDLGP